MALRFLLVSLVAGMGFELPSAGDVSAWAKAGRDWVDARVGDIVSLKGEAERALAAAADCERDPDPEVAPTAPAEVPSTRDDLAFEAIVEKMASDFAADLATIAEPKPADEAVAVVEPFRVMPPAAWTDPEAEAMAEEVAEAVAEEVAEARPEVVAAPKPEPATRVEKISAAVRLTKQALGAWAALIQPPAVRVAAEGPDGAP